MISAETLTAFPISEHQLVIVRKMLWSMLMGRLNSDDGVTRGFLLWEWQIPVVLDSFCQKDEKCLGIFFLV